MDHSVIDVAHHPDGRPSGATAALRVDYPVARVWAVIVDIDRYPGRIPMIHRVRRSGDQVTVELKFRVAILSVGFQFVVEVKQEPERWLELRWLSGEPRGLYLRIEVEPLDDGRACMVRGEGRFDPQSLGFLAKYFLKHHPEIEYGIMPGVALALVDSMRRAVQAEPR